MRRRKLAREIAKLLADGRPLGCTCPPSPMDGALPSDNRHMSSSRCPYTAIERAARNSHHAPTTSQETS